MSINDINSIDMMGQCRETGKVILTLIDDMNWLDELSHLLKLQEKLNAYLAFVESGQIFEEESNFKDKVIKIEVCMKYKPTNNAEEFLDNVKDIILKAGFEFEYYVAR